MEIPSQGSQISFDPSKLLPSLDTKSHHENSGESMLKFVKCSFPVNNADDSPKIIFELPEEIVSSPEVFYEVVSKNTWDHCLSDEQRAHLAKFLPANVSTAKDQLDIVAKLFDLSSTPYLSHPLVDFQQKLQAGYYDEICSNEVHQLKECARLHYEYRIREYYGRVLKKLLVNRRKLLEAAAAVPEGCCFSYDWKSDLMDRTRRRHCAGLGGEDASSPAWLRAQKRARLMVMECKARSGEYQVASSDDEDYVMAGPSKGSGGGHGLGHLTGQHRQQGADSGRSSSVRSTLAKLHDVDLDLHEPVGSVDIKDLLKEYRYLRRFHSEHPSLEFDDIELEDVIDRCDGDIKLLAQKCGVYKKGAPTCVDAGHSTTAVTSPAFCGGSKKATGAKTTTAMTKDNNLTAACLDCLEETLVSGDCFIPIYKKGAPTCVDAGHSTTAVTSPAFCGGSKKATGAKTTTAMNSAQHS